MAVDTSEITPPPASEAPKPEKAEKQVFTGDYVPDATGKVTVVLQFPAKAVESGFNPIKGILALATNYNLKGYGPNDTPQCTVGTERAKIKNDAGESVDNPRAGQPNGNFSIVLHTDESLAEARKRGRAGKPDEVKKAETAMSNLLKSVLAAPGALASISELVAQQERGEISMADVVAGIEAMKQPAASA